MGWPSGRHESNFQQAKTQVSYTANGKGGKGKGRLAPYHLCTNFDHCGGWELVRNHRTHCRKRQCGAPMHPPPIDTKPQAARLPRKAGVTDGARTPTPSELLEPHMATLEAKFPGLALAIKDAMPVPAVPQPAAALHNVQSQCQIAFKAMQASEDCVAAIELEAAQLSENFRTKIDELRDAQQTLCQSRKEYDAAAHAAQLEVEKHKAPHPSVPVDIVSLLADLPEDQLQSVSAEIEKIRTMATQHLASMDGKSEKTAMEVDGGQSKISTPTTSPKLQPQEPPMPEPLRPAGDPADRNPVPAANADGTSPETKVRQGSRSPRRALSPGQKSGASSAGSALSRKSKQSPEHYAQLATQLEERLKLSKNAHVVEPASRP